MGFEMTRFVDQEIDQEFQCSICTLVMRDPKQTSHCEHSFCKNCIEYWLLTTPNCPVDGRPLTIADLRPPSRLLRNLLDKLNITCDFRGFGCMEIIRLDNLQNHGFVCYYNPDTKFTCDRGCNLKITRREYQAVDCHGHLRNKVRCQQARIEELEKEVQLNCRERDNANNVISELNAKIVQQQGQIIRLCKALNKPTHFLQALFGTSSKKK